MTYKHFVTVTSQAYFCASPIRLDSYNRCQFACVYCFSRERSIKNAARGTKEANPAAFRARLERIASGRTASALDEFLERRVPLQFGGMQDPFSPWEKERRVSLRLLETLKDHDYPTIISTKGALVEDEEYLRLLSSMNVVVRLSAAGVPESARGLIDYKCSPFSMTLRRAKQLRSAGVPVALRIQPVVPGCENDALEMTAAAAEAGVQQVSYEFLKLPLEKAPLVLRALSRALRRDVWASMQSAGIKRIGPDYTLDVPWKLEFLRRARTHAQTVGLAVGAGDTELIHLSDGGGCCNGSAAYLRDAHQFTSNLVGATSRTDGGSREIRLSDLTSRWSPTRPVSTYMMTDSRSRDMTGRFSDWFALLAHRWNGGKGPYSPALFAGVSWGGAYDSDGFKIYRFDDPLAEHG